METETKDAEVKQEVWRLANTDYVIFARNEEGPSPFGWAEIVDGTQFVSVSDGSRGEPGLSMFTGKAWADQEDTLLMTSWKVHDDPPEELHLTTLEDVKKYLASLPKWDKTKYFLKAYDFDGSTLRLCATGAIAPKEVIDAVMPKFGFSKMVAPA